MNQLHHQQWSDVIVERKVEWEGGPESRAVLLIPRFRRGPLAKWLQPRLKRPYIRVTLDDLGSFVWKHFDKDTPFSRIAQAMRDNFGDKAEPAEDRLKKFLLLLRSNKFVELFEPASSAQKS
jgi:hypothetical protein